MGACEGGRGGGSGRGDKGEGRREEGELCRTMRGRGAEEGRGGREDLEEEDIL